MSPKQQALLSCFLWQEVEERLEKDEWSFSFCFDENGRRTHRFCRYTHTHIKRRNKSVFFFTVWEHKWTITCLQGVDRVVSQCQWLIDYSPAAEISGSLCSLNSVSEQKLPLIPTTKGLVLEPIKWTPKQFYYSRIEHLVIYHLLTRRLCRNYALITCLTTPCLGKNERLLFVSFTAEADFAEITRCSNFISQ